MEPRCPWIRFIFNIAANDDKRSRVILFMRRCCFAARARGDRGRSTKGASGEFFRSWYEAMRVAGSSVAVGGCAADGIACLHIGAGAAVLGGCDAAVRF